MPWQRTFLKNGQKAPSMRQLSSPPTQEGPRWSRSESRERSKVVCAEGSCRLRDLDARLRPSLSCHHLFPISRVRSAPGGRLRMQRCAVWEEEGPLRLNLPQKPTTHRKARNPKVETCRNI
eukprot:scaffold702_cov350-Pinguiococcus_pyrenoidosus.AAC.6